MSLPPGGLPGGQACVRGGCPISDQREALEAADEQAILDDFQAWAPEERDRRRKRADQARERALRANDEAVWQHAEIVEQSYAQLDEMLNGGEPYFARVRGQLRDPGGEAFVLDVRVHKYARSEVFPHSGDEMLAISHLTALADLVRNPAERVVRLSLTETDLMRWPELRGGGTLEVMEAAVEDVEMEGGRVVRVAPRYGAVFEDRVKRRLRESARPGLEILADVLDRHQNEAINDRDPRHRLTILDGPAGTGKTVVAAHRVAVLAPPGSPGIYLTPSSTLRDYVGPALPRLGLERSRVGVLSIDDLAMTFWPGLAGAPLTRGPFPVTYDELERAARAEIRTGDQSRLRPLLTAVDQALRLGASSPPPQGSRTAVALGWIRRWRDEAQFDHLDVLEDQYRTLRDDIVGIPAWPGTPAAGRIPAVDTFWRSIMRRLGRPGDFHPVGLVMLAGALDRPWPGRRPAWAIVDEAQAAPPGFYQALGRLLEPGAPVVLAGDLMQRGRDQGLTSWEEARTALKLRKSAVQSLWLGRNYRVPPRIHRTAERLRRALAPEAPPSESVPWHPVQGEVRTEVLDSAEAMVPSIGARVEKAHRDGISAVAVLAPDEVAADRLEADLSRFGTVTRLNGVAPYRGGLTVGTMESARGLEFDLVILAGVDADAYPGSSVGAERLYTALTRARRAVHLLVDPTRAVSSWVGQLDAATTLQESS